MLFKKLVAFVFVMLLCCTYVCAVPFVAIDKQNLSSVLINGSVAIRFRVKNGNIPPAERARITAERLRSHGDKLAVVDMTVKGSKKKAYIYLGEALICLITEGDARASSTDAISLANVWAKRIKNLAALPSVYLSTKNVLVPLNEARTVSIGGTAQGEISLQIAGGDIAECVLNERNIVITGKKVGVTSGIVTVGNESLEFYVDVKEYAGYITNGKIAEVTGTKCPWNIIKPLALSALNDAVHTKPGATHKIDTSTLKSIMLSSGSEAIIKLPVTITGEGYIPVTDSVSVVVKNIHLKKDLPNQLFYSNDPEMIKKYQTLFVGRLANGKPTRVLYHHQNMMGKRAQIILEIVNPNPNAAKYHIVEGISEPNIDTILVGHVAGNEFMRNNDNNIGYVKELAPNSRYVIVSDMLNDKITSSGIIEIYQMLGDNSYVRVTAAEPGVDNVKAKSVASAPSSFLMNLSDHVYPNPTKNLDYEYEVGKSWTFISVGKHALTDSAAQKMLYGNYGVTYNLNIRISNPLKEKKKVSVVFDATAGLASGMFKVDGKYILKKYANSDKEVVLSTYDLAPGESKLVKVSTIPLSGSNYPVKIIVKS